MDSPLGGGSQIGFPRAGSCPVAAICVVCGNNCRVLLSKQKTDHKAQCLLPSGGLHTVNRRRFRVFLLHMRVLGVTPVAGFLACRCHVASVGRCSCYERLLLHLHCFRLLQFWQMILLGSSSSWFQLRNFKALIFQLETSRHWWENSRTGLCSQNQWMGTVLCGSSTGCFLVTWAQLILCPCNSSIDNKGHKATIVLTNFPYQGRGNLTCVLSFAFLLVKNVDWFR